MIYFKGGNELFVEISQVTPARHSGKGTLERG
jgi:hypothetical protein